MPVATKYCCADFAEQAGEMTSVSPFAIGYPQEMRPDAQFHQAEDGTWYIAGCCGGGCNVVNDMKFCPYCGTKL